MKIEYEGNLIPWATLWSGEKDEIAENPHDQVVPYLMGGQQFNTVQPKARLHGVGKPLFGEWHGKRAHLSVTRNRCLVCGNTPLDKDQQQFWAVRDRGTPEVFEPGKLVFGNMLPTCPQCAALHAEHHDEWFDYGPDGTIWLMGVRRGIVGGIISPRPDEQERAFAPLDKITADWVVHQWVVQVEISAVVGDTEQMRVMLEGQPT